MGEKSQRAAQLMDPEYLVDEVRRVCTTGSRASIAGVSRRRRRHHSRAV